MCVLVADARPGGRASESYITLHSSGRGGEAGEVQWAAARHAAGTAPRPNCPPRFGKPLGWQLSVALPAVKVSQIATR